MPSLPPPKTCGASVLYCSDQLRLGAITVTTDNQTSKDTMDLALSLTVMWCLLSVLQLRDSQIPKFDVADTRDRLTEDRDGSVKRRDFGIALVPFNQLQDLL